MNRERTKELLPIFEAFANGEDIQRQWHDSIKWEDVTESDWLARKYRIKPKIREFWVNLYNKEEDNEIRTGCLYKTREEAERYADPDKKTCIKVIEVIDG